MMGGNGQRLAFGGELSDPRAEDHRAGQADRSAQGVDHAGTGKVDGAVAQPPVAPAWASQPPPQIQLA